MEEVAYPVYLLRRDCMNTSSTALISCDFRANSTLLYLWKRRVLDSKSNRMLAIWGAVDCGGMTG